MYYGKGQTARRLNLANATEQELTDLARACDQATFGLDEKDVLDESYRKARKMDSEYFSSTFNLADSGLMDTVRSELLEGENEGKVIKAELYKLNVYEPGAFFKTHKDTPRSETMFGSLVLVFPTRHEGGSLLLRHDDQEWEFDSAKAVADQSSPAIGYIAFYSDVEHEVTPVTSGHRVTLTYNLYFIPGLVNQDAAQDTNISIVPSNEAVFRSVFAELLGSMDFLPEGGKLGFGLSHQYAFTPDINAIPRDPYGRVQHSRNRSNNVLALQRLVHGLKGSDATIFRVCQGLSLKAYLRIIYNAGDALMMANHVVNIHPDEEVEELQITLHNEGAIFLEADQESMSYFDPPKLDKVHWVTKVTPFNQVATNYVRYGNQASLGCVYGDMCLIVEVGKLGHRTTA